MLYQNKVIKQRETENMRASATKKIKKEVKENERGKQRIKNTYIERSKRQFYPRRRRNGGLHDVLRRALRNSNKAVPDRQGGKGFIGKLL